MAIPLSYNVRNVRQRWQVTVLAIGGIALVVAVFVILIALYSGFRIALASSGSLDNGLFVQRGSSSEITSGIARDDAEFLSVDSRVARDDEGRPLASPEIAVAASLPRRGSTMEANVQLRGVSPMAFKVRRGIEVIEGRMLSPGLQEVIVGTRVVERFDVALGSTLHIKARDWKVVGVFTAEGSSFESEVWGDVDVMASVFNRQGGYQSLTVRLVDTSVVADWATEVLSNPRLQLELKQERQYYDDLTGVTGVLLLALAGFVAVVMGIGAVFGAMNTMYAVVAQRTREIATLRALGFSRFAILISFVLESMFIAVIGGALGCVLGFVAELFPSAATGNVTFSEIAFAFTVTPASLIGGMVFALVMGFVGGLLPAVRAARMPLTVALREA
jgi:putative ABC transport system permease protein